MHDDPITWQSEAIRVWKSMAAAMATFNLAHPNQQVTVQTHYPELFEYPAVQEDTFLTPFELETG